MTTPSPIVGVRLDLAQTALGAASASIGQSVKSAMRSTLSLSLDATGQTTGQKRRAAQLDQVLGLLNTQAGDRYLFSGRAVDQPAVDTMDHILNGERDAGRASSRSSPSAAKPTSARSGLGRLVIPAASGTTRIGRRGHRRFAVRVQACKRRLDDCRRDGDRARPARRRQLSVDLGATNPSAGRYVKLHVQPAGRHDRRT